MSTPKVSVIIITYNQEGYIGQSLESIVTQQTAFAFEVIVADDSSTDGTASIVREYAAKYPEMIKPILRDKNLGPQPNFKDALIKSRGQYVAICEGDDFWTDVTKLQRQADFLDSHKDYALCFHPVRVFFENGEEKDSIYPMQNKAEDFTVENLLKDNFIQTNSVLYRRRDYSRIPTNILPLDWYMHLYHAQAGKIGFINRVMAAYRRHPEGIWWNSYKDIGKLWSKYGEPHLALYEAILKMYPNHSQYVIANISTALEGVVASADDKHALDAISTARRMFSNHLDEIIQTEINKSVTYRKEFERQAVVLHNQAQELDSLTSAKESLAKELTRIKSTKTWKVLKAVRTAMFYIRHPIKAMKSIF